MGGNVDSASRMTPYALTLFCSPSSCSSWRQTLAGALSRLRQASACLSGREGPAPASHALGGQARALDGDTLSLGGLQLRLWGIDAPELLQTCGPEGAVPCGRQAADALSGRLEGRDDLFCEVFEQTEEGRGHARCLLGAEDLGAWMVREGYARLLPEGRLAYGLLGERALEAKKGFWQDGPDGFGDPAQWRTD